jgi:DNA-binding LacI/PurR family transcriptional regulator
MDKAIVGSQIESEIRLRISSGFYAPGAYLPSQQKLAKEFQTSQTTIAKALDQIRQNGIIERTPRRGTRVIPFEERSSKGSVGILHTGGAPLSEEASLIINGICKTLGNNNQHYEFISLDSSSASSVATLIQKYSGCIFVELLGEKSLPLQLEEKKYPYIVANLEYDLDVSCTWADHTKATSSAVHTLAAMGHRRILLLTGELDRVFYSAAFEGYKTALKELNIEFNQSQVITVDHYAIDGTEAYKAMQHYLENHPPPTAIVACRDYLAWGACQALRTKNIKIGYDVSIIGFDNITWPGEESFLTTFNEPAWDMGCVAAEMLVERLIFGWKPVEKREIEASLILRRSAGPCWEL